MRSRRRYPGRHAGPGPHPGEQGPAAYGAVADYLAAVAARLRGSVAARVRITDELRDGLLEAVEAYQARGRALQVAIAAAIAEFGDPHIVAEAFGPELATQVALAGRAAGRCLATRASLS
jgi:HAAS